MNAIRQSPVFRGAASILIIATCIGLLYLLERIEPAPPYRSILVHGAFDVTGHLLTALVVAIGVRMLRFPVPLWAILVGGVVIDAGHGLTLLQVADEVGGSTRNATHSLIVVALLALIGFIDRRHAHIWLGIAMGATSHLWRDMGTGTLPLLWPLSNGAYGTSFNRYLAVLGGVAIAMIGTASLLSVHAANVDESVAPTPTSSPEHLVSDSSTLVRRQTH